MILWRKTMSKADEPAYPTDNSFADSGHTRVKNAPGLTKQKYRIMCFEGLRQTSSELIATSRAIASIAKVVMKAQEKQ